MGGNLKRSKSRLLFFGAPAIGHIYQGTEGNVSKKCIIRSQEHGQNNIEAKKCLNFF